MAKRREAGKARAKAAGAKAKAPARPLRPGEVALYARVPATLVARLDQLAAREREKTGWSVSRVDVLKRLLDDALRQHGL